MSTAARWRPVGSVVGLFYLFWLFTLPCSAVAAALPPDKLAAKPQVVLVIEPCLTVSQEQVRHLVAVELGAQLVDDEGRQESEPGGRGLIRAHIGCAEHVGGAPGLLDLHVDDGVTGKELSRTIDLAQQDPAVHPRLIALALAELVFASWAELLVTPRPRVLPATQPPPEATREATSNRVASKLPRPLPPSGVYLLGIGGVMLLFTGAPVLAGGGLRIGGDHLSHLSWDADVTVFHGSAATALGSVTGDLLSARIALLAHHRLPHLLLRAGGGLRVGAAHIAGTTQDPTHIEAGSLWAPWGGPHLGLSLAIAVTRLRVELSLEGGYVLWSASARVAGTRPLSVQGPWLGGMLGIGLGPRERPR